MFNDSIIVIDQKGAYVKRSGNRFVIKSPDSEQQEYSADVISQLLFTTPASAISTSAIQLAVEKNIDIVYLDWKGHPFARTYSPVMGGTTRTRRKQLEAYFSYVGGELSRKIVEAKIKSQMHYLRSLSKDRKDNRELQKIAVDKAAIHEDLKGTVDEIRQKLLGMEGSTAAKYFKGLGLITGFAKRDPKASDNYNVCLNYAYGILYGEVERACILAGLDPYLGFYHTDRYGKPSMALDVMELFRVAVADRAVVTLFNRGQIDEKDFEKEGDTTLTRGGRKKIIDAVIGRLNTEVKHGGKTQTLKAVILSQAREIASFLLGHRRDFKPFIYQ